MCPKLANSQYHQPECIARTGPHCAAKTLPKCPVELEEANRLISFKVFEYVPTGEVDAAGNPKKHIEEVLKSESPKDFLTRADGKVGPYIVHSFEARWQDAAFRECIATFPPGTVVSVADFAENYSFQIQNQIQSLYWRSQQVTIFVQITYRHAELAVDGVESSAENLVIKKEMHFNISDSKEHGTVFVQHCFLKHLEWLKEKGVTVQKRQDWSDGCSGQFKSAHAWYFVARFEGLTGVPMSSNFFASGHGKGEHDGAGAVVKSGLRKHQLLEDGSPLSNAAEVVELCRASLSGAALSSYEGRTAARAETTRTFWLVTEEELATVEKLRCKTIPGSRSMHSVRAKQGNPLVIFMRKRSCFCVSCLDEDWDSCENKAHVGEWVQVNLQPSVLPEEGLDGDSDDEPQFGGNHDELSSQLTSGDNFAVVCDDEQVDYYILQCTKSKYKLTEAVEDEWGGIFSIGDVVVEGVYFELQSKLRNCHKYILLDERPKVIMYSHLVRSIRVKMSPESKVEQRQRRRRPNGKVFYTLAMEDHEDIMGSLEQDDLEL
jgi:hypothetical protein